MVSGMKTETRGPIRHFDRRRALGSLAERILVVCPGCGGQAMNIRRPDLGEPKYWGQLLSEPRRLVCTRCERTQEWTQGCYRSIGSSRSSNPSDPHFNRPLWLQTWCAGNILWAINEEHLEEMAGFVGAQLREHGPHCSSRAMLASLPLWMKRADNRAAVLAGLDRLRRLAAETTAQSRPGIG